jgi:hypothetical protein
MRWWLSPTILLISRSVTPQRRPRGSRRRAPTISTSSAGAPVRALMARRCPGQRTEVTLERRRSCPRAPRIGESLDRPTTQLNPASVMASVSAGDDQAARNPRSSTKRAPTREGRHDPLWAKAVVSSPRHGRPPRHQDDRRPDLWAADECDPATAPHAPRKDGRRWRHRRRGGRKRRRSGEHAVPLRLHQPRQRRCCFGSRRATHWRRRGAPRVVCSWRRFS